MKRCKVVFPLLVCLLLLATAACGGKKNEKGLAKQLDELAGVTLKPDDIQVESARELGNNEKILETRLRVAFRMHRDKNGQWRLAEVRLGDRQWEDISKILTALDAERARLAREDLSKLAMAIEKYADQFGDIPRETDIIRLTDALFPRFMRELIREDPWGISYHYAPGPTHARHFYLRSAGPDRKLNTSDDLMLER